MWFLRDGPTTMFCDITDIWKPILVTIQYTYIYSYKRDVETWNLQRTHTENGLHGEVGDNFCPAVKLGGATFKTLVWTFFLFPCQTHTIECFANSCVDLSSFITFKAIRNVFVFNEHYCNSISARVLKDLDQISRQCHAIMLWREAQQQMSVWNQIGPLCCYLP